MIINTVVSCSSYFQTKINNIYFKKVYDKRVIELLFIIKQIEIK